MTRTRSSSLLLVLCAVSACGPSGTEAVRPKAPSASAALGEATGLSACHDFKQQLIRLQDEDEICANER